MSAMKKRSSKQVLAAAVAAAVLGLAAVPAHAILEWRVTDVGTGQTFIVCDNNNAACLLAAGAQGVALKVTEPAGNPCCDGPESRSGETWRVFADSPHGVAELLSVTTARDDSSHSDDPDVDEAVCARCWPASVTTRRHR